MTARTDRISLEVSAAKKAFSQNKNIVFTHTRKGLVQYCDVTYFVKGIQKLPDNSVETAEEHKLRIYFPLFYPFVSPVFKFITPIWHPSVKNGNLCLTKKEIECKTLIDIIIFIGQVIQYKEFPIRKTNKKAQKWAEENKNLWPKGRKKITVKTLDTNFEPELQTKTSIKAKIDLLICKTHSLQIVQAYINSGFSFKTILHKYLIWAVLAAVVSFSMIQITSPITDESAFAWREGHNKLSDYFEYSNDAINSFSKIENSFYSYCKANGVDKDSENSFIEWYIYDASKKDTLLVEEYLMFDSFANDALNESFSLEFDNDYLTLGETIRSIVIKTTSIRFGIILFVLSFLLCLSDGLHYGSKLKAILFALLGSVVTTLSGYVFASFALTINSLFIKDTVSNIAIDVSNLICFILIGIISGLAVGLTKRSIKRLVLCISGGLVGAVLSSIVYNIICVITYSPTVRTAFSTLVFSLLIALFIGIGEQLAKNASLKVINNKSYRKEYMIFSRKTRIGYRLNNTILIGKDKGVAPRHLFIVNDKNQFILLDYKTLQGTFVNGEKVSNCILKKGDKISLGNTNLEFYTK